MPKTNFKRKVHDLLLQKLLKADDYIDLFDLIQYIIFALSAIPIFRIVLVYQYWYITLVLWLCSPTLSIQS